MVFPVDENAVWVRFSLFVRGTQHMWNRVNCPLFKYTGNADGTHYKQLSAIQWLDTESHSASITKNELSWCNVLQKECLFTLLTSSSILLLILLSIVSLFSGVKSNFNMFHRVFFFVKMCVRMVVSLSTANQVYKWSDLNLKW